MKNQNKRKLQQIAINHLSDINSKDFIRIYEKCTTKPYSFRVNGTTLASDNPLTYNEIMTINDQIRDEKLQYDINREAAKISALSSGKIDKNEYVTGEKILPSNQQQIIEREILLTVPREKLLRNR